MTIFDDASPHNRLIIGANGGIGSAIAAHWKAKPNIHTLAMSRHGDALAGQPQYEHWACDHSETQIQQQLNKLFAQQRPLTRVVIATGMLSGERGPEKSLQQCQHSHWQASMQINAWLPMLWLQQLEPYLKKQNEGCIIAVLSARVGSISDNRLGGWHSYRSSKAALNMLLKTISIEWSRTLPQVKLMAFHPGTTDTALSKPFQKNVPSGKLFKPAWVAQQLDDVMASAQLNGQCDFIDWAGKTISW